MELAYALNISSSIQDDLETLISRSNPGMLREDQTAIIVDEV